MKKIYLFILTFFLFLGLTACTNNEKISIILPSGTPSLALGNTIIKNEALVDYQVVQGADSLVAAFTKADKDIIIAPVNLGLKLYNANESFAYVLYHPFVWCNYYLVSTKEITSIKDLQGKSLTVFGKNQTPDIITKVLLSQYEVTPTIDYVNDVATANALLLTNKAEYIVSAEPSVSVLKTKANVYTYSLATLWQETFPNLDVPQAGIFVKKQSLNSNDMIVVLDSMVRDITNINLNKEEIVKNAKIVDPSLSNANTIYENAITGCNYKIITNEKEATNLYFTKLIELKLGITIGGKLPDDEFYFQK